MGEVLAQIVAGEFRPGDKPPRETDVAEPRQVSRYVAREATRRCGSAGWSRSGTASARPWRRATMGPVRPGPARGDARRLAGGELTAETLECRTVVGPEAAAPAAKRRPRTAGGGPRRLEAARQARPCPSSPSTGARRGRRQPLLRRVLVPLDGVAPRAGRRGAQAGLEQCAALSPRSRPDPDAAPRCHARTTRPPGRSRRRRRRAEAPPCRLRPPGDGRRRRAAGRRGDDLHEVPRPRRDAHPARRRRSQRPPAARTPTRSTS